MTKKITIDKGKKNSLIRLFKAIRSYLIYQNQDLYSIINSLYPFTKQLHSKFFKNFINKPNKFNIKRLAFFTYIIKSFIESLFIVLEKLKEYKIYNNII